MRYLDLPGMSSTKVRIEFSTVFQKGRCTLTVGNDSLWWFCHIVLGKRLNYFVKLPVCQLRLDHSIHRNLALLSNVIGVFDRSM